MRVGAKGWGKVGVRVEGRVEGRAGVRVEISVRVGAKGLRP